MSRAQPMRRLWRGLALLLVPAMSQAIEEPAYELLHKLGDSVEIRRYAPYVVAEVLIAGPAGEAGNQAFPILAGYIFGKNKGERKFAMTAPVTQTSAPARLNDNEHFEQLTAALRAAKMSWAGAPVFARYDAPWTPWFLRRNEAWLSLP
jgi:hypothetical protein